MNILLVGGGSGGHVTPLKAINDSLKSQTKEPLSVTVITDRGFYDQTKKIFADDKTVQIKKIFSGKYRRYASKSFMWHILHLPTFLKNIRDVFLLGFGLIQSMIYFLGNKPDVLFCKGGFVSVPVGIAAHLFSVPIIIHDSDTRPGLTNRILAKWATKIATGMPTSFYNYEVAKMIYTGIPVDGTYKPVSKAKQDSFKTELSLEPRRPLLLVTGGGNGSVPLNKLVCMIAEELIDSGWNIVHLVGKGKNASAQSVFAKLSESQQTHWVIEEFAPMVPRLLAADLVISRTSASTVQECANARKPVIGIPSSHLDDQKMNAEFFASKSAIVSLDETELFDDAVQLREAVTQLKKDPHKAAKLAGTLYDSFAKPHAANELAELIIEAGKVK